MSRGRVYVREPRSARHAARARVTGAELNNGYRLLAAAVLARAVADLLEGDPVLADDARAFIGSLWCDALAELAGVDVGRLRRLARRPSRRVRRAVEKWEEAVVEIEAQGE